MMGGGVAINLYLTNFRRFLCILFEKYSLKILDNKKETLADSCLEWPFGFFHQGYRESVQFSPFQLLSHVRLFAIAWIAARQASLSITSSWSSLRLVSIESVMPFNHLILCRPLLLLPSIFPNIRTFSNESAFHIRWQKYWSFNFNISPSNEHSGLIFRMNWLDLLTVQSSRLYSASILRFPLSSYGLVRHVKLALLPSLRSGSFTEPG